MPFLGSSAKQVLEEAKSSPKSVVTSSRTNNYNSSVASNIKALGASDNKGVSNALETAKELGVVGTGKLTVDTVGNALNKVLYGSSGVGASPTAGILQKAISGVSGNTGYSGYSGSGSAAQVNVNGEKSLEQIINETVDKNNAWAAEQAQKQMDFQKMMSDTAHRREIEDLKAAGLNPILSVAGGSGAPMASGAKAEPDTSNTRLLAEMSLASTEALGNSAVQLASGYRSAASNNFASKLLNAASKYVVPTLARGAARALSKGLFG